MRKRNGRLRNEQLCCFQRTELIDPGVCDFEICLDGGFLGEREGAKKTVFSLSRGAILSPDYFN